MFLTNALQNVTVITNMVLNLPAAQKKDPQKIAFSLCYFLNALMYFCKFLTVIILKFEHVFHLETDGYF